VAVATALGALAAGVGAAAAGPRTALSIAAGGPTAAAGWILFSRLPAMTEPPAADGSAAVRGHPAPWA
jgi:hypothetical protein